MSTWLPGRSCCTKACIFGSRTSAVWVTPSCPINVTLLPSGAAETTVTLPVSALLTAAAGICPRAARSAVIIADIRCGAADRCHPDSNGLLVSGRDLIADPYLRQVTHFRTSNKALLGAIRCPQDHHPCAHVH